MSDPPRRIEPLGETMLLLVFGERVDAEINTRVHAAAARLRAAALPAVIDLVPAYATLGLRYRPEVWAGDGEAAWRRLARAVRDVLEEVEPAPQAEGRFFELAICYGGEFGPDLEALAQHARFSPEEVVARHTAADYRVAMIGFAPGFAYLLGLDPRLVMPRRAAPRLQVPAGSVAIGGAQTGIYPRALPGGWQLIGRSPQSLFDPGRSPPCLLAAGDRVRFRAVDAAEFRSLAERPA